MKKISRVSTIISAIMLLTYIIVLISIWSRIPDTVPTHFNAAGVAKETLHLNQFLPRFYCYSSH